MTTKQYRITLLPGDGIGPEIMDVAVAVLQLVGKQQNIEVFQTIASRHQRTKYVGDRHCNKT